MAYTDLYGVEFSDDKKTLIKCPRNLTGEYSIPWGVEIIGKRAFFLSKYTSVYIPKSVRIIEDNAFDGCFQLENIEIHDGVISIGKYAFNGCRKLSLVHIPASVSNIGEGAFTGCSGFRVDENNEIYDSRENCNAIIETSSDTLIYGCADTTIPYGVKHIGNMAFRGCSRLRRINIPDSVTSIGYAAFMDCPGLNSVTIGNRVTSIGNSAFANCTGLTNIVIPHSVVQIGHLDTPNRFSSADGGAFSGCTNLKSIEIPLSVSVLGAYTFVNCSNLSSVVILNSAIEIENNAFYNCKSLEQIQVPNGCETRFYYMECFKNFRQLFHKTYQRNIWIRNIILTIFFIVDVISLYYVGKGLLFQSAMLLTGMLYAPFAGLSDTWFLSIVMFIIGLIGLPFYGCFIAIIAGLPLSIGNAVANLIIKDELNFKDSHVLIYISIAIVLAFGVVLGLSITEYDTKNLIIAILSILIAAISPIVGYGVANRK